MSDARRRARALVQTASRIARETSAHERFCVVSNNDDGTISVAQAHWPAGKSVKVPWNHRGGLAPGAWVLGSRTEGTIEVHDYSAYSSGVLPS